MCGLSAAMVSSWHNKPHSSKTEIKEKPEDGVRLPTGRGHWKLTVSHATLSPYAVCLHLNKYSCGCTCQVTLRVFSWGRNATTTTTFLLGPSVSCVFTWPCGLIFRQLSTYSVWIAITRTEERLWTWKEDRKKNTRQEQRKTNKARKERKENVQENKYYRNGLINWLL